MMMMAIDRGDMIRFVPTMLPKLVKKIRTLIMSATMTPKRTYSNVYQAPPGTQHLITNKI